MEITITTKYRYRNVNPEWYAWWLSRFKGMPEYEGFADQLERWGEFAHDSKYESGNDLILGTTIYEVKK